MFYKPRPAFFFTKKAKESWNFALSYTYHNLNRTKIESTSIHKSEKIQSIRQTVRNTKLGLSSAKFRKSLVELIYHQALKLIV